MISYVKMFSFAWQFSQKSHDPRQWLAHFIKRNIWDTVCLGCRVSYETSSSQEIGHGRYFSISDKQHKRWIVLGRRFRQVFKIRAVGLLILYWLSCFCMHLSDCILHMLRLKLGISKVMETQQLSSHNSSALLACYWFSIMSPLCRSNPIVSGDWGKPEWKLTCTRKYHSHVTVTLNPLSSSSVPFCNLCINVAQLVMISKISLKFSDHIDQLIPYRAGVSKPFSLGDRSEHLKRPPPQRLRQRGSHTSKKHLDFCINGSKERAL